MLIKTMAAGKVPRGDGSDGGVQAPLANVIRVVVAGGDHNGGGGGGGGGGDNNGYGVGDGSNSGGLAALEVVVGAVVKSYACYQRLEQVQ